MTFRLSRTAAALAAFALTPSLHAQTTGTDDPVLLAGHPYPPSETTLDTITVTAERAAPSLTSPDAHEARHAIEHVPGGVDLVEADEWRDSAARTLKDVLDYTPGVFVQPKWGEDSRLSIRGSGLSRNFHLRGVQLLVDGIPMNAADGSADFQEIDPTAFAYSEVYKGANALRYGANSLGGALQFFPRLRAEIAQRFRQRRDARLQVVELRLRLRQRLGQPVAGQQPFSAERFDAVEQRLHRAFRVRRGQRLVERRLQHTARIVARGLQVAQRAGEDVHIVDR